MSQGKSRRIRERLELALSVRVRGRDHVGYEWTEMTHLLDVSPFGARFQLKRAVQQGRLVQLTLGMPRQLRSYDYFDPQYEIWGLVRHAKTAAAPDESIAHHEVGVAFIGKHPPASYEKDPMTVYEIDASRDKSGLWDLREVSDAPFVGGREQDRRRDTRINMPVEVIVEVLDDKGAVTVREQTVTENISPRGAAVFTTLNVAAGGFVRLRSARYDFAVSAVVRARRAGADKIMRLHLEFIGRPWPIEGIE